MYCTNKLQAADPRGGGGAAPPWGLGESAGLGDGARPHREGHRRCRGTWVRSRGLGGEAWPWEGWVHT